MGFGNNGHQTLTKLNVNDIQYNYFSLAKLAEKYPSCLKLPFSLKVLLENLLRYEDNDTVTPKDIQTLANWADNKVSDHEIAYRPVRVLMQDFTGVPAIVDLAAMRDAIAKLGGNPEKISPLSAVDLVIDHSVMVDAFGNKNALETNTAIEMQRNIERYQFLRWGQTAFKNFRVVPPGTGICHQVNLEYLAKTIWSSTLDHENYAFPDTLVGTDSHTTMINGLGVLGWGVGGIEAEAAMLGQPVSMLIPEVIGFKLTGQLQEGITATDLVLTITHILRKFGVVGKFVEFFGPGLQHLTLADRATIANMAPEYGATCGFFPIDQETINYLKFTGRDQATIDLVKSYAQTQSIWYSSESPDPIYTNVITLDLASIVPTIAGPKRPQDKITLSELPKTMQECITQHQGILKQGFKVQNSDYTLHSGDLVIAAITSCTNTSNPSVLMAAGLLAKKARMLGLKTPAWVKTSLAPGSKVVTDYLHHSGLQRYLDELGFNLVGYGCTTCIGNSGPLPEDIANCIQENNLVAAAVLSGNRNFEGRIHPQVKANWLASPPLVVAFALAGTMNIDLTSDPIAKNSNGKDIYLKDVWPTNAEIRAAVSAVTAQMFTKEYADVFKGSTEWQNIAIAKGETYSWDADSTYIQHPPYFQGLKKQPDNIKPIVAAKILAIFGDSITTDHISPAGSIKTKSPAGEYLIKHGVDPIDFNSYGSRRGNHEVMMRGTFANIRIKNEMTPGQEGGITKYLPTGEILPIYDAAMHYKTHNTQLVIFAGKEYGTGSSRDWAAKGTRLLGVEAVIAESFERIHRSNLIGMGVLPLQFINNETRNSWQLTGNEQISISLDDSLQPKAILEVLIQRDNGDVEKKQVLCKIDTGNELQYYKNQGILQYVLRQLV